MVLPARHRRNRRLHQLLLTVVDFIRIFQFDGLEKRSALLVLASYRGMT